MDNDRYLSIGLGDFRLLEMLERFVVAMERIATKLEEIAPSTLINSQSMPAATNAAVEKFTAQNRPSAPCCEGRTFVSDIDGRTYCATCQKVLA